MRPLRLELEGFTSFRDHTEIDFTDTDLFVLSGAMGAGKSSVIDAMGFALYGAISRFHNMSLVAPVISQGLQEARVQLAFRLGEADYEATRVVRRNQRGGATAPEARLTRAGELLAGTAGEVTDAVSELLGLNFEQFNRCVVLPQGEFAELLHARPSERQALLVQLLDIGLYRRVGEAARNRERVSNGLVASLRHRIENELRDVTVEAYRTQEQRVGRLSALLIRLEADEEVLQALHSEVNAHRAAAQASEQVIAALQSVKTPAGVKDLDDRLQAALDAVTEARKIAREAADELAALQEKRGELPERALIEGYIARHRERALLLATVTGGEERVAQAQDKLAATSQAVEQAEAVAVAAEEKSRSLERAHSAYHASRELKPGDVCPVCGEKLTAAPKLSEPKGLSQAINTAKVAQNELRKRQAEEQGARLEHGRAEDALNGNRQRLQSMDEVLEPLPDADACAALIQAIDTVARAWNQAVAFERQARTTLEAVEQARASLQEEERRGWEVFNAARDGVAAYGAPAPGENVAMSWDALVAWAAVRASEQEALRDAARTSGAVTQARIAEIEQHQAQDCEAAGVSRGPRGLQPAVIEAKARAEADLHHIDERLAERTSVERDLRAHHETARVAGILGLHLDSRHFERWYLEEAMTRLVDGATMRLGELSDGQYSLGLNQQKTDFVVIDHINANEERPVRTLSGGETFLASLALALALGDDIANLAANGSARLDALFLDEGFGALDQNTLETVASAIEELGARGRMVGIVTHVPDLADRIPVQYRVAKSGGSSRVERVEAG